MKTQTYVPAMNELFSREGFEKHLQKIQDEMWRHFEMPGVWIEQDEPEMSLEDELATMTPDEQGELIQECYLDGVPAVVLETWAKLRSARLKEAWYQAAEAHFRALLIADEAHNMLRDSLPHERRHEVLSDLHIQRLWAWAEELAAAADAAEDAYHAR